MGIDRFAKHLRPFRKQGHGRCRPEHLPQSPCCEDGSNRKVADDIRKHVERCESRRDDSPDEVAIRQPELGGDRGEREEQNNQGNLERKKPATLRVRMH